MVRLAALVPSYECGAFALAASRCVQREWVRSGRPASDLEVVVVDDASPSDQGPWLARAQAEGVRVVRRAQRGGYAAASLSALACTHGEADDAVALLNADVLLTPGALEPLLAALARDPGLGAVAPRAFADPACTLELPPQELPTPADELGAQLAALCPALARRRAAARLERALRAWSAESPYEASMLSGACLVLRREWIERSGGLLDARYPLYFEDTDLCRRLRAAGARLAVVPDSRIVHFWARSTGLGEVFERRAAERFRVSRRRYLERWHGPSAADAVETGERLLVGAPGRDAPIHHFTGLGAVDAPPLFELDRPARFVLQIGLSPTLGLAAGALSEGARWTPTPSSWEWLHPARYFARALDRGSRTLLGAWSFDKRSPARDDPQRLDLEDLDAGGELDAA